ncbi:MAG: hypothetical protein J2P20_11550 [Pseudonocardia sp.]|nr:hypothetical protein [Pseudonocardia sp.]
MYFDVADPSFSVQSRRVRAAGEGCWYVRTNYGLAVLRYHEAWRAPTTTGSDGCSSRRSPRS